MLAESHRYCPCERARPYKDPDWDIGLERGYCRVCGCEVHPRDVRRLQAIAAAEIAWREAKGRSARDLLTGDA
jgi:hypothetical protein